MSSREEDKRRAREAQLAAERAQEHQRARRRRISVFGAILAAAAVIVLAAVLISRSGSEQPPASEAVAAFAGIPQDGPRLGRPDAPVVVEEFLDMQCPFCAQFATDRLPALVRRRVRTGDVQLRQRVLAFLGQDSVTAGRAAVAAGLQDRQWQFTEAFYSDQGTENSGYVTEQFLRDEAAKVPGLDADRMLADSDDPRVRRELQSASTAAQRAEVNSTPTFLVSRRGGKMTPAPAEEVEARIDAALRGVRGAG